MTTILTLILSATLAIAAATAPNATVDVRNAKLIEATTYLAQANIELGKLPPETTPSQPVSQPSNPQPSEQSSPNVGATIATVEPVDKSDILIDYTVSKPDPVNNMPYGAYNFMIRALDTDGKAIEKAPITMEAPHNIYGPSVVAPAHAQSSRDKGDWFASFQYVPTTQGPATITFTANGKTKTLDLTI